MPEQLKLALTLIPAAEPEAPKLVVFPHWYLMSHGGRGNAVNVLAGRHPLGEALNSDWNRMCGSCLFRDEKDEDRCTRFSRDVHGVNVKRKWVACVHYKGEDHDDED